MAINTRNFVQEKKTQFKNTFILDIDGTLCDIDTVFFKMAYALSYFGLEVDENFLNERKFLTLSACGIISEEDEKRILTLFEILSIWENLKPFPGVVEFLQKISNNGNSIIYLTSRKSSLRKATTTWLEKNGLPRPSADEFGNEDTGKKVTLMMSGPYTKSENLSKIKQEVKNMPIYYFENEPVYIREASQKGFKNIYTFEESYIVSQSLPDHVKILKKPKFNPYASLDEKIFK